MNLSRTRTGFVHAVRQRLSTAGLLLLTLLVIEFLDELFYGVREAALPFIREDLALNYVQIGILLGLPHAVASVIEPFVGILADLGWRRHLILIGGVICTFEAVLMALAADFNTLLMAFCIGYPAAGAFVSLSQATLMDTEPDRHEQNMARWTFVGSLGVFVSPLILAVSGNDWRRLFLAMTLLIAGSVWALSRLPIREATHPEVTDLWSGWRAALRDLRRFTVLRWLVLLQFSGLLLDVFYGYLALYMVDVAGADPITALLAVGVWTGVGLLGDFVLIPVLEYVRGLTYLRYSAIINLILFPLFLLVPGIWPKLGLLGLLGFFNAGWYSVLQGQLYSALPGRSGSVITIQAIFGVVDGVVPFLIGAAAQHFGLASAIWLLLLGPIALLVGLPRGTDGDVASLNADEDVPDTTVTTDAADTTGAL